MNHISQYDLSSGIIRMVAEANVAPKDDIRESIVFLKKAIGTEDLADDIFFELAIKYLEKKLDK